MTIKYIIIIYISMEKLLCVTSIILFAKVSLSEKANNGRIVIAGLFPLSESVPEGHIGRGVKPAVNLARDMINKNKTILPHYHLEIIDSDTKCSCCELSEAL